MTDTIPVERRRRPPVGGVVLGIVALILLIGLLGALAFGVFSTPSEPTRSSAELVQMAPDAIAGAPGLGYRLSIETKIRAAGRGCQFRRDRPSRESLRRQRGSRRCRLHVAVRRPRPRLGGAR